MSGLADAFMGVLTPKENSEGMGRIADLLSRQETAREWNKSVMSRPVASEWAPDHERPGGHATEPPMVSPDDLIGPGLLSKTASGLSKGLPALAAAIDPLAKKRLIADLLAARGSGSYKLGEVTAGQQNALAKLFGQQPASPDVMMTDGALRHIVDRRMAGGGFSPDDIGRFAENALRPKAEAELYMAGRRQNPSLVNRGLVDLGTKKRYDAKMPLFLDEDGNMSVMTIIPKGLP